MAASAALSPSAYDTLGAAVIRSLTADPMLQWSGKTLYRGTSIIALNAAHQHKVQDDLGDTRALLDGAALRLQLSNASLHAQHLPDGEVARLVFELLEQLRVESLASATLIGLKSNLSRRFIRWTEEFMDSGLCETAIGILILTIAAISWSRLNHSPIPEDLGDLIEATRANIVSDLGADLAALSRSKTDQSDYLKHALAISQWAQDAILAAQEQTQEAPLSTRSRNGFRLQLHFESQEMEPPPVAQTGVRQDADVGKSRYRVFTREYDRENDAADLVRSEQLSKFRAEMDEEIAQAKINLARLARFFRQQLASPLRDRWEFSLEQGYLDATRLSQLIADPQNHQIFKDELDRPTNHAAVTLLLDCSGSMKSHSIKVSLLADMLTRTLEWAGASVELLGFTTQAWNGGRSLRDWQHAGRPDAPGRLNELQHLVFKPATQKWSRSRRSIAALRRLDLYREGVDGEALDWACKRLLAMSANRRILMVISDGCPMDSATHQTNDAFYLDRHLQDTVQVYSQFSGIEICALGVGLDLGCFYRNRLAVDLQADINEALLLDIGRLITKRKT